jgi:tetratricopeptide (TPR) repeat protein
MEYPTCRGCGATFRAARVRCRRCGAFQPTEGARKSRLVSVGLLGSAAIAIVLTIGLAVGTLRESGASESAGSSVSELSAPPAAIEPAATDAPDAASRAVDSDRAGQRAYGQGDVAGAVEEFEMAVAATPRSPRALNNLAQALVRDGRAKDAIVFFDQAIEVAPGTWAYHFNRARAYAQMQEWDEAIAGYHTAAALFPDDYVTQFNLAKALQASGDIAGAIAGFGRAIALAPGQADFHRSHGLALEAARRPQDAAAAYHVYLALDPTASDAEQVRTRIRQLEGDSAASAVSTAS